MDGMTYQNWTALECRTNVELSLHGGGPRPPPSAAPSLREAVIDADGRSTVAASLAGFWGELLQGNLRLADAFYSPNLWYAVLLPARQRPVSGQARSMMERVLLGDSQKRTAIDYSVTPSKLSGTLRRALNGMGAATTPCKVPPLFALFAQAELGSEAMFGRLSTLEHQGRKVRIVSTARPELDFRQVFPRAEYEVMCRLVEGRAYDEIAAERNTTRRTIANQTTAIFRKLGVSGRSELVSFLVSRLAGRRDDSVSHCDVVTAADLMS
jgi:DNA-binding CsgD family transcriptional regulator